MIISIDKLRRRTLLVVLFFTMLLAIVVVYAIMMYEAFNANTVIEFILTGVCAILVFHWAFCGKYIAISNSKTESLFLRMILTFHVLLFITWAVTFAFDAYLLSIVLFVIASVFILVVSTIYIKNGDRT